MNKLTRQQNKVLEELREGKKIYVFFNHDKDSCSYGYDLESTVNRLYLTLTCRSLVEKGLCRHWLVDGKVVLVLVTSDIEDCTLLLKELSEDEITGLARDVVAKVKDNYEEYNDYGRKVYDV